MNKKHIDTMNNRLKFIFILVMLLAGDMVSAQVKVGGNVYGGGEIGKVTDSAKVTINVGTTVAGSVYGGGQGVADSATAGWVKGNTLVTMTGGQVDRSIYGGGELGSVGTFTDTCIAASALHVVGEPTACQTGTGLAKVLISGGQVGINAAKMPEPGSDDDFGYVFCGGRGEADSVTHPKANLLAVVDSTYLEVSGSALITASAYGGSENGLVLRNTHVKIMGGQIGTGHYRVGDEHHWDDMYGEEAWNTVIGKIKDGTFTDADAAGFHECDHWAYEAPYDVYDVYANESGYNPQGGSVTATDGHTFYGNVFGGGSGYYPYAAGKWRRSAGRVGGDTKVEITGGHILTSVYGGNEQTDVLGSATVTMTGGTIGVPRTLAQIAAHPVTCYLFGGGKGDQRVLFNTWNNVESATVDVSGGIIFGSVFGGGEDGHVHNDVALNINPGAFIGTWGTSYVDGNVFGAGRGFSGDALTAGTVGGNVEVNITGGTMLGSVYGGGRLASVGTEFTNPANTEHYGHMQSGDGHGNVVINISGGTIGNSREYVNNPSDEVKNGTMPYTEFDNDNKLTHTKGGNVFAGSMGRLTLLDNSENPLWPRLAKVKNTTLNISDSALIKSNVYGGGEFGFVTENTRINVNGGTIGTSVKDGDTHKYYFGSVYGGGYGTIDHSFHTNDSSAYADTLAGRVYGNTRVDLLGGIVWHDVYGGGEMASVGYKDVFKHGNTYVNIGSASQVGHADQGPVIMGEVYGANNISGTPYGSTYVNVYSTKHIDADAYPSPSPADAAELTANALTQQYALSAVYGGGNLAAHTPSDTVQGGTHVNIYYCKENTVRDVFGGGNAAATRNNNVVVDGGRIHRLFGGGNGEEGVADVLGNASTAVHGGLLDTVFGGSNVRGNIFGSIALLIDDKGAADCDHIIGTLFGGGNEAPGGGGTLTIACSDYSFSEVYGGSHLADIKGDVTLNILGGTYGTVYAGSKGKTDRQANIDGNVNLNLHGGTIGDAFGGSNVNGNISGVITVNVEDTSTNCALALTNLYGASNLAQYTPDSVTIGTAKQTPVSPVVNVKHVRDGNSITGYVFGGGKGMESTFTDGSCNRDNVDKGRVTANPQVNIGDDNADHYVKIDRNVYGGGEIAEVNGSTEVNMQNAHSHIVGNLFGAGRGYVGDSIAANVLFNTSVNIMGGKVSRNVYGGGELASVGTFTGTAGHNDIAEGTGLSTVTITGGHIGADDADHATSDHADGNVYGAGLGRTGTDTTDHGIFHFAYYNYTKNTDVTIGGDAIVRGSVFGGGEDGHVWNDTKVKIKGGEIGTDLTAAEEAEDNEGVGANIYTGNVYGGGRGIDESDLSDHTHSLTAGRVFGNTYVEVSGGIIHHDVFGGGSLASVGDTIAGISGDIPHDIMGNEIAGSYTFDTIGDTLIRAYQVGDPVTGTGLAHVRIVGGRIGNTGHNEGSVFGSGRGLAGDAAHSEYYHMAYVHNSVVYIGDTTIAAEGNRQDVADVRGAVFGGGANGHVTQNTYVKVANGIIGGKTADTYTLMGLTTPATADTTVAIKGTDYYSGLSESDTLTDRWGRVASGRPTFLGNVYAGGRGVDHNASDQLSRFAGRVFGNATVEITGGVIYHNVYGGGSMATVGHYTNGEGLSMLADPGTGKAIVKVAAGRIGTNGRNNGRVYGAGRGLSGSAYAHMSYVNSAFVTIGDTSAAAGVQPYIRGSVFGSGANGHVQDSTLVVVNRGVIGNGRRSGSSRWINEFVGNVYGGGRGVDLAMGGDTISLTAGRVYGSTHVVVNGGHIHHNVYGGGSLASVGTGAEPGYRASTGRVGRAKVDVHGGFIGLIGSETDSSQNLYGNVYGGGRGRAGVGLDYGNDYTRATYVNNTEVTVDYTEALSATNRITGNVYGGGNNGHVNNSTSVTITRGQVGTRGDLGYGSLEGNVFGGGRGEDTYPAYLVGADGNYITKAGASSGVAYNRTDRSAVRTYYQTPRSHNDSLAVVDSVSVTAGLVYGNTHVTVNAANASDAVIKHHVYGGGANASVGNYWIATGQAGEENYDLGEVYLLTPGTGTCTVDILGGTLGTAGINNGMVFGASRGDIGNPGSVYDSIAYVNNTVVTIGTAGQDTVFSNPVIHGSVYGGGENGHTVGDALVTIHSGRIGNHSAMYDRVKEIDDMDSPTDSDIAEMNRKLDSLAFCGNVYGGGCGTDKYDSDSDGIADAYNTFAGVVFGNTTVNMDGGYVERNIYGGGAMANIGRRAGEATLHTNADTCFALSWPVDIHCRRGSGLSHVSITGGARVGYSGKDNGDIFGGSRGEAGDRYAMARLANVDSTTVVIALNDTPDDYYNTNPKTNHRTPLVAGSVYGGSENGHVVRSTNTTLTSGIIGHALYGGGKGKGTYTTTLRKRDNSADSVADIYSITAGRVYRNTYVTMTGGKVIRNIFGGGNMASVGKGNYSGGPGDYREAGYGERWDSETSPLRDTLANSGHTYVTVTGGTVGILDPATPKNSFKDDLPLGNVFGGCRGEAAPMVPDNLSPRYAYAPAFFSGYVNHTHVIIGTEGSTDGPRLYGSVYGGGQDGHVRVDSKVDINSGEIGVPYVDEATAMATVGNSDLEGTHWIARGNVFGAGSGIGQYTDAKGNKTYSTSSGSVTHFTTVTVNGGTIHNSVYGGGAIASVGPPPAATIPDTTVSLTRVFVKGGQIGSDVDFAENEYGGSVYGASRGLENLNPTGYATDIWAFVSIEGGAMAGNVFGGGEIGHVRKNTWVNVSGGTVGASLYGAGKGLPDNNYKDYCNVDATFVHVSGGQVVGDVYGGSQNGHVLSDTYVNISGSALIGQGGTSELDGNVFGGGEGSGTIRYEGTDTLLDLHATCGRVGGNTHVTMTSGMLHGSIFGGGRLALTGVDVDGNFVDSLHGNTYINVSGGTVGTDNPDSLLFCDWSVGDIFGSGKGDIDTYNDVLAGRVTNAIISITDNATVRGGVFGGGEMASIGWWDEGDGTIYDGTGAATVTINGGIIGLAEEFTYTAENNPGEWTMYDDDGRIFHTCTGNVYGGSQGDVDVECPHWVSMGRSRTGTVVINGGTILGCVFGGAEQGIVTGNTSVTVNGGTIGTVVNPGTADEYTYGDVYAAGYGCDDPSECSSNAVNDSTAGSQAMNIGWEPALLAGRTFGNARVDILGGTIKGGVYGGGSFASVGDDKPGYTVNGNTLVNIGSPTAGSAVILGDVFGANNYSGTPFGNTAVHIYHTAHTDANSYPDMAALKALAAPFDQLTGADLEAQYLDGSTLPQGFALNDVYGGGNLATHMPIDTLHGSTLVYVHECAENTIRTVYGGGNAANTRRNHVVIDGGRINRVFGGGNGYSATGNHTDLNAPDYNPGADVLDTASTRVHGGLIDQVYGGSNQMGNIGFIDLVVDHSDASCPELIDETFGGGNEAEGGSGVITIDCGIYAENFYAGANAANLGTPDKPVTLVLNVRGGNIGNLFGGCKGTDTSSADIYGDVVVNFYGGHVVNLFGGSDVNGNISGTITVNVDIDPEYCCADGLNLDYVFGGGRDAAYTPFDPFRASPTVNIMNNRYRWGNGTTAADSAWVDITDVFGGGLGASAKVTSYPRVVVGGFPDGVKINGFDTTTFPRAARVFGNVYGGGSEAPVVGNSTAIIRGSVVGGDTPDPSLSSGNVFGGGLGATAKIDGETYVGIFGLSDIKGNVYGGGNAGIVTGNTELQIAYQEQVFPPEFIGFIDTAGGGSTLKGRFQCTTPGVAFSYTKDGSMPPVPATAATLYTGPFTYDYGDTVLCIAYLPKGEGIDSSMIPSVVAFDKATAPVITIRKGSGNDPDTVSFDGAIGSRIHYTLDGSEPTASSSVYGTVGESDGTPFTIADNQVVKAMSEMRGCYGSATSVLSLDAPTVAISGNSCTITGPVGSTLVYTTDNTTPVSGMGSSTLHGTATTGNTVTFTLDSATTVRALAKRPGYLPSAIGAAVYNP